MPRFFPNAAISDCWSSVGGVTFYHYKGACYYKNKNVCTFAGTPEQLVQADIHRRALAAWQGLAHNVQEVWNLIAVDAEPHRPPFGSGSHISGFNLFVSAYHGFARLGSERIPEPRVWEDFPSFYLDSLSAAEVVGDSGSLMISARLHFAGPVNLERYRLLGQIQLVRPGKGSNPGLMRTFLAEDIARIGEDCKECRFTVPAPSFSPDCQMHSRMRLIDSTSGYRSQYLKCSKVL